MLAPWGSRMYCSCTNGYACSESAVTSSLPSSAHSFSDWMSASTCSNSKSWVSTAPAASPQNMNASSGSGLCPSRICTAAEGTSERAGRSAPTEEPVLERLQELLAGERLHELDAAVAVRDVQVVRQRAV